MVDGVIFILWLLVVCLGLLLYILKIFLLIKFKVAQKNLMIKGFRGDFEEGGLIEACNFFKCKLILFSCCCSCLLLLLNKSFILHIIKFTFLVSAYLALNWIKKKRWVYTSKSLSVRPSVCSPLCLSLFT